MALRKHRSLRRVSLAAAFAGALVASNGGSNAWDSATAWTDDVSWAVAPAWA